MLSYLVYARAGRRLRLAAAASLARGEVPPREVPPREAPRGDAPPPARRGKAVRGRRPPSRAAAIAARSLRLAAAWALYAHVAFVGVTATLAFCYRYVDPPVTVLALSRKFADGFEIQKPRPASLETTPRLLRRMLIAVEDSRFYEHPGFDIEAFKRAARVNKEIGQPMYGGSTLTMQLARTLFLVPAKSYLRKYLELIVAVELELILGKDRILELYLSWAEWGRGAFGVEAAARAHYKKPAAKLSFDEQARLVALLSSPIRYRPQDLERRGILRSRYEFLVKRFG